MSSGTFYSRIHQHSFAKPHIATAAKRQISSSSAMNIPIIISGGGISGLCLGLALKKQQIPYLILEKSSQYHRNSGGGIGLWGPALKALRILGVEELLHGKHLSCAGYRTSSQLLTNQWLVKPNHIQLFRHTSCLCLRRSELQDKLLTSLDPNTIRFNSQVTSIQQTEDGVSVELNSGEIIKGSILVGADGIDSMTRKHIFPSISPSNCGYYYWQGIGTMIDSSIENQQQQQPAYEAWHPGIRFGMVPLPDNECFWFVCSDHDLPSSKEPLNHLLSQLITPFGEDVVSLVARTNINQIYRADLRDIPTPSKGKWSNGRIICIGDAMHAMAPNLAQGACLAIEDAIELANQLGTIHSTLSTRSSSSSSSSSSLELEIIEKSFQQFVNNRSSRTKLVQFLVPLVHQMGAMSSPYCHFRNIFFMIFPNWFKTKIFDLTHQLALGWSYTPPNLHQGLYHRFLSFSFLQRHPQLSLFHKNELTRHCSGPVSVTVSNSWLIQSILSLFSLPSTNISLTNGFVSVEMICDSITGSEIWNRTFYDQQSHREYHFLTKQSIFQEEMRESYLDFFALYFQIIEYENHFDQILTNFSFEFTLLNYPIIIPLPSWCHPVVRGRTIPVLLKREENDNEGKEKDIRQEGKEEKVGWNFEVELSFPKWCRSFLSEENYRILKYAGQINKIKK